MREILPNKIRRDESGNDIDLSNLLSKALKFSFGKYRIILENLDRDRKHILNPLSHDDNRNISSLELKNTISDLETLNEWKPKIKLILPKYTNMKSFFEKPKGTIHNYIFNLDEDLFIYSINENAVISDCKCSMLYCYEEKDDKNLPLKEFKKTYPSLYNLGEEILKHNNVKLEKNYYELLQYNKNGAWKNYSLFLLDICKNENFKLLELPKIENEL